METKQLTVEFSRQDLQRLIVPLVVEQLLAITVGLFDSVMVSQVGEAAISAVSLVETTYHSAVSLPGISGVTDSGFIRMASRLTRRRVISAPCARYII